MKILICGSRDVKSPLDEVGNVMLNLSVEAGIKPSLIISGGARGVDKAAVSWARAQGIEYKIYPADWNTYGKGAGYIRNMEMLDNADMVVAIWDGESRGTLHTITEARKRKMPLVLIVKEIKDEDDEQ